MNCRVLQIVLRGGGEIPVVGGIRIKIWFSGGVCWGDFFRRKKNEQIFGWWGGSPIPPVGKTLNCVYTFPVVTVETIKYAIFECYFGGTSFIN